MNTNWIKLSVAAKRLPAKLLNAVKRSFGTRVEVKPFSVFIDRDDRTGKLTYTTVLVRIKRKGLVDMIAVYCLKTWRYFTDELHAEKAFFHALKPSTGT